MKKRKWTSQEKLKIILEGLSGQIEITKLCTKYQIANTQYYLWRGQLLKYGRQAFESKNITKKERHLEQEVGKLKKTIGDLTMELKKANSSYETQAFTINYPERFTITVND
jgi:transposase-like protein